MPICEKCFNQFNNRAYVEGKRRNLQNRKYCLSCSPWGCHNTIRLNRPQVHKCRECGEESPEKFYGKRKTLCSICANKDDIKRFKRYKKEQVEYKGGKCVRCGYDKSLAALEFHHIDPSLKDKDMAYHMQGRKIERCYKELDKCILLCSNCHKEEHESYNPLVQSG